MELQKVIQGTREVPLHEALSSPLQLHTAFIGHTTTVEERQRVSSMLPPEVAGSDSDHVTEGQAALKTELGV